MERIHDPGQVKLRRDGDLETLTVLPSVLQIYDDNRQWYGLFIIAIVFLIAIDFFDHGLTGKNYYVIIGKLSTNCQKSFVAVHYSHMVEGPDKRSNINYEDLQRKIKPVRFSTHIPSIPQLSRI